MAHVVAALYKFVTLADYHELRSPLLQKCLDLDIKGTLLLAHEGINGTIAGSRESMDAILAYLKSDPRFSDLDHKESLFDEAPFYRMKVKCKKEIVTMGVDGIDPNLEKGQYVKPEDWNALINDPDVVVIDTRNDYEYELGTFEGAVNPHTESFREFPDYVKNHMDPEKTPKVAMFCTGGIRCEKSTAYMRQQGFKEVYHLQGGILKYLEEVPEQDSQWHGECYVFDNRVAVNHQLERGRFDLCHGCRYPVTEEDKLSDQYEAGVSCPRCHDSLSEKQRARFRERQKQVQLAKTRRDQHIGSRQKK